MDPMGNSHKNLLDVKPSSAVGGHLGRRAEPPDTFLEENHPMTISSKFCSY
jgi:hypothetical protein